MTITTPPPAIAPVDMPTSRHPDGPADIVDVAEYILAKSGPMTSMKLHKLVYYCQAWHLAWGDGSLFDERIEAWANGPVVPALFVLHHGRFTVKPGDLYAARRTRAVVRTLRTAAPTNAAVRATRRRHRLAEARSFNHLTTPSRKATP